MNRKPDQTRIRRTKNREKKAGKNMHKSQTHKRTRSLLLSTFIILIILNFSSSFSFGLAKTTEETTSLWTMDLHVQPKNWTPTPNNQSFVFTPFQEVDVMAIISYNGTAHVNSLVAFKIIGPLNSQNQATQVRTAQTDENGTATIEFRIPQQLSLGSWQVNASVSTTEQPIRKSLTFKVEWPTRIVELSFRDSNGTVKTEFSRNENISIQTQLETLQGHSQISKLVIDLTDTSQKNIGHFEIPDLAIENCTIIEQKVEIPKEASIGVVTVNASIYSGKLKDFDITAGESTASTFRLKAASIEIPGTDGENETENHSATVKNIALLRGSLSSTQEIIGEPVNINITAKNTGQTSENFVIKMKHEKGVVGSINVTMHPQQEIQFIYQWNTTNLTEGAYVITVYVDPLFEENQTSDNKLTAGSIILVYPQIFKSEISLFIIALAMVGVFTFSLLYTYIRRNQKKF